MPVTDAYATAAEYRDQVGKGTASEDTEILRNLTAISRYIDKELGRFFTKDAANTVRIYQPFDGWRLDLDDTVSVATVEVDVNGDGTYSSSLTVGTDYQLEPLNAATGSEPEPYTVLRIVRQRQIDYVWARATGMPYYRRVRVTGVHGWPAVPAPIKEACIQLAAILRIESSRATLSVDEAGRQIGTSRQGNEIVRSLMERYEKSSRTGYYIV